MPSYKLIYFDARGRAETARIIFKLAGVEFEDKRIVLEEWADFKSSKSILIRSMILTSIPSKVVGSLG